MWTDAPIPAADVVDGNPHARTWDIARSRQGGVSMNYWDCTSGCFRWHYAGDEMVQILEGEVHVTDADDVTRTLRAGDTAHFEAGTTLHWDVPEYVRKLAFHRNPASLADRVLTRALRLAPPQRVAAAAAATSAVVVPMAVVI